MVVDELVIKQLKKIAKEKGYDEISLNIKKKKPLIIEGLKGCFIPEVLCSVKGEIKALITFIKSLESNEEFYKLTLFMDYARKNSLYLHIAFDERRASKEEIVQKFREKGLKMPKNTNIMAISL